MAPSSEENTKETKNSDDQTMDDDDETVVTESRTTKTDFIEAEMNDLTIRYEIPYRTGEPDHTDYKHHVHLLIALTQAFDKSNLRIYDNNNKRVKSFSEPKWLDKEYFQAHFTTHDNKSQRKTLMAHRVMSNKPVATLKNDPAVLKHLKQSGTYLRAHFWSEDQVLLKDIGFLVSYVPTKHSRDYVLKDIHDRCNRFDDVKWSQAPAFKVIHAQPKIKLSGKKQPLKTHAFSVQVQSKDAPAMNQFLRTIYEDEHLYVPYSMKKKYPQAVARAIQKQNKCLNNTWVIVLIGVTREMMPRLTSLSATKGVIGISDTNRTDKQGRWHVLVAEDSFKNVRKILSHNIKTWVNALPENSREHTSSEYPSPQVYQKNHYQGDDDSSSGQASYMSSCAQSYGSFDDTTSDDQFSKPPGRSYASAVSGINQGPLLDTDIIVSHKTAPALNSANTIAKLQAEVKSLRTQLLGAHTPSTVTESSAPEHVDTADRMALLESNMASLTSQFTLWMTEARQNMEPLPEPDQGTKHPHNEHHLQEDPSGPHPKRANTRTTPTRGDAMETQPTDELPNQNQIPLSEDETTQPSRQARENESNLTQNSLSPNHPFTPERPIPEIQMNGPGYDPDNSQKLYSDNGDGPPMEPFAACAHPLINPIRMLPNVPAPPIGAHLHLN
jgi:hypothetical protein